jgi:Cu-Zn family superoxide dismutase
MNSGAHFNPHNMTHGAPTSPTRHVGDLGNIDITDPAGVNQGSIADSVIQLESGEHSIVGRAVGTAQLDGIKICRLCSTLTLTTWALAQRLTA